MSTAPSDLPDLSGSKDQPPLRFVTAASLFDGHDAAINIMRRLIQARGVEVIHLGHNRSVEEIVQAAIQEDADGIAVSSYQGGHNEFFRYMVDRLRELGAPHIKVFGGGGGTITPEEIRTLMDYGVERIYHPHDGMSMGLEEMISDLLRRTEADRVATRLPRAAAPGKSIEIAATMSAIEEGVFSESKLASLRKEWQVRAGKTPVIGITGTGGAGKSSVTDEILNRFLASFPGKRMAVLAVDPTRRFKLVANLPYNVATPILSNLLSAEPLPASMTVTIQKELADRIADFHAAAEPVAGFGGRDGMRAVLDGDVENLRRGVPDVFNRASVDALAHEAGVDEGVQRVVDGGQRHADARTRSFRMQTFGGQMAAALRKQNAGQLDALARWAQAGTHDEVVCVGELRTFHPAFEPSRIEVPSALEPAGPAC